jgi:hypothetical protein
MSQWFTENFQIVPSDAPSDLAAAAVTGDWISLRISPMPHWC